MKIAIKNFDNKQVREVELELSFCGTEFDPIDRFGLGRVEYARLHRVNLGGASVPPVPVRPVSPLFLTRHLNLRAF